MSINIAEIAHQNETKYLKLKEYCKSIHGIKQDIEYNFMDIFTIIDSIENFNINDVIFNYKTKYRYTTILEVILKTQKFKVIDAIFAKYLHDIKTSIKISDTLNFDLLSVMYANLDSNSCQKDVLTPLMYKFENLDFLNEEDSISQKLVILRYLENQKDNNPCTDEFLERIKVKYQEILESKERNIYSKFQESLYKIDSSIKELISEDRYEMSEKMKNFKELIITLKKEIEEK